MTGFCRQGKQDQGRQALHVPCPVQQGHLAGVKEQLAGSIHTAEGHKVAETGQQSVPCAVLGHSPPACPACVLWGDTHSMKPYACIDLLTTPRSRAPLPARSGAGLDISLGVVFLSFTNSHRALHTTRKQNGALARCGKRLCERFATRDVDNGRRLARRVMLASAPTAAPCAVHPGSHGRGPRAWCSAQQEERRPTCRPPCRLASTRRRHPPCCSASGDGSSNSGRSRDGGGAQEARTRWVSVPCCRELTPASLVVPEGVFCA